MIRDLDIDVANKRCKHPRSYLWSNNTRLILISSILHHLAKSLPGIITIIINSKVYNNTCYS